jgi:hypothetical protein
VRTKYAEKAGVGLRADYVLEKLSNVSRPGLMEARHYMAGLPGGAGQPRWVPPIIQLHATVSNRPLRRILTIVLSQFDPRATVHLTELYKQRQTPLRHL